MKLSLFGALLTVVSGDAVKTLSAVDLDKLVAEGKTVFTKFYSPKCPHCVRVAPLWEELATKAADVKDFVVAEIDCTANRETCKRYNVQGVPSLQLVKDGQVYLYKGAREVADFVKFALEQGYQAAGVTASALPGAEQVKTFSEKVVEGVTEVFQQFSAIANYSPMVVFILLALGFLSGASVTGLLVLASKPKAPCENGPCEAGKPCEASKWSEAEKKKKAAGEKTD